MSEKRIWSRFARIMAVATLISDREGRGCTLYEIMDLIGANNRSSAFNILDALDEMGFAYYTERATDRSRMMLYKIGKEEAMRWKNTVISSVLSEDDIRFLNLVLESVSYSSPIMSICGDDFISKLRMVVSPSSEKSLKPHLASFGPFFKLSDDYFKILLILLEAAEKKIRCHIVYESRNTESIMEYDIYPVKVVVLEGAVYVKVINNYNAHQLLALSRIKRITKLTHEEYPLMKKEDGDYSDPFPFYRMGEVFTAEVLVDEYQAWYEIQKAWPESVKYEKQEDGSFLFTLQTASSYGLLKWVLGMGQTATVLKPEKIRRMVIAELEAMGKRYSTLYPNIPKA